MRLLCALIGATVAILIAASAHAQVPAPTPVYTGSFGGGLAITGGNTETKNFNLAFNLVRDPKTRNIFKAEALYLRGTQNDVLSLDRASVKVRDEYAFDGAFVFGEMGYLRDQFKDIQYLLTPIVGLGYRLIDTDDTEFALSGGAGGFWEKNTGLAVSSTGNVNAGQTFSQRLSSTATLTQSISSIAKTNNFTDTLTNFAIGLTTSISSKLELKIEFQDNYKNRPPDPSVEKNDTAFVTTFLLKY